MFSLHLGIFISNPTRQEEEELERHHIPSASLINGGQVATSLSQHVPYRSHILHWMYIFTHIHSYSLRPLSVPVLVLLGQISDFLEFRGFLGVRPSVLLLISSRSPDILLQSQPVSRDTMINRHHMVVRWTVPASTYTPNLSMDNLE